MSNVTNFISLAMTVRDYVQSTLKNREEIGIPGYHLQRTTALDKPYQAVILPGKKRTYIDYNIKEKEFVPDADYDVRT